MRRWTCGSGLLSWYFSERRLRLLLKTVFFASARPHRSARIRLFSPKRSSRGQSRRESYKMTAELRKGFATGMWIRGGAGASLMRRGARRTGAVSGAHHEMSPRKSKVGPLPVDGSDPTFSKVVRRCPALPPGGPGSTLGADGLSFRVRDGYRAFPRRHGRRNVMEPCQLQPPTVRLRVLRWGVGGVVGGS